MITVTGIDLTNFNRVVARFHDELGLDLADELRRRQIPLLVEELVKQTPPKNLAAARSKIESDIGRVFWFPKTYLAGVNESGEKSFKRGRLNRISRSKKFPGTTWLIAAHKRIVGVLTDMFKPDISIGEMSQIMPDFKPPKSKVFRQVGARGVQAVMMLNRVATTKARFSVFVSGRIARIGRLKAGWMACGPLVGTIKKIPQWVTRHATNYGRLGYCIDGLGVKSYPTFTIVNTARGAGDLSQIASKAIAWRTKQMELDIAFRIRSAAKRNTL